MRTLATTTDTNDIFLNSNGDLEVIQNAEAVANICLNKVRTLQGELLLNTQFGIPYLDILYSAVPNIDLFRFQLRKIITNTENVVAISNLEMTIENNILNYRATIKTTYGEAEVNG